MMFEKKQGKILRYLQLFLSSIGISLLISLDTKAEQIEIQSNGERLTASLALSSLVKMADRWGRTTKTTPPIRNEFWETNLLEDATVRAKFVYYEGAGVFCQDKSMLEISRFGRVYLKESPGKLLSRWRRLGNSNCSFKYTGLQLQDLDNDRESEVVLNFHIGRRELSLIYGYNKKEDRYIGLFHYWAEHYPKIEDLDGDGIIEFVGSHEIDNPFIASSRFLIREIWQYRQGVMHDVTRCFPEQIRQDVESDKQHYIESWLERRQRNNNGETTIYRDDSFISFMLVFFSYAAHKHLLGEVEDAWQNIRQYYDLGNRENHIKRLSSLLEEQGYVSGTHTRRIELKPRTDRPPVDFETPHFSIQDFYLTLEANENEKGLFITGNLSPSQQRIYLIESWIGKKLSVTLIGSEKGILDIRILSPDKQLLGIIDRQNPNWKGDFTNTSDYAIEIYSPYGGSYSLTFQII